MKSYDDEESRKVKNNSKIVDSFNNAINGIIESISTERNMFFHMFMAFFVIILAMILDFTRLELIVIGLTIVFVLVAELFNTAIEVLTDLASDNKYHELAKKTKDIAAGAVLLSAIASVFVGYLLIYPKIKEMIEKGSFQFKAMENVEHMIIISIVVTLIAVLLLKGIFYKKNTSYLFGGSVSGHAALAFNLSTIATILADNISLIIIVNMLAVIVAESRYEAKIHSLKEVILGAILGISLALLLFMKFI